MPIISSKKNLSIILLILVIASFTSPLLTNYYHGYKGFILLFLFGIFNLISNKEGYLFFKMGIKTLNRNKVFMNLLIWYILGIIFSFFRGFNDIGYFLGVLLLPMFLLLGMSFAKNKNYRSLLIYYIFLFSVINNISAGWSIGRDINARTLVDIDIDVGNTEFWGMIGIFMPLFFLEILKQKQKLKKLFMLILFIYLSYKLIYCGYATPIALFIINIFLIGLIYLIWTRLNFKRVFKGMVIFISSLLFAFFLIRFLLLGMSNSQTDVQSRFQNFIENPLSGGYAYHEKEGVSRFTLIDFSWETFINNPILGGGGNIRTSMYEGISGGHSSAIDILAVFGLLGGGGAFVFLIFLASRNAYINLKKDNNIDNICNFAVVLTFIIGGIMNPYWAGTILLCLLLLTDIYIIE